MAMDLWTRGEVPIMMVASLPDKLEMFEANFDFDGTFDRAQQLVKRL